MHTSRTTSESPIHDRRVQSPIDIRLLPDTPPVASPVRFSRDISHSSDSPLRERASLSAASLSEVAGYQPEARPATPPLPPDWNQTTLSNPVSTSSPAVDPAVKRRKTHRGRRAKRVPDSQTGSLGSRIGPIHPGSVPPATEASHISKPLASRLGTSAAPRLPLSSRIQPTPTHSINNVADGPGSAELLPPKSKSDVSESRKRRRGGSANGSHY